MLWLCKYSKALTRRPTAQSTYIQNGKCNFHGKHDFCFFFFPSLSCDPEDGHSQWTWYEHVRFGRGYHHADFQRAPLNTFNENIRLKLLLFFPPFLKISLGCTIKLCKALCSWLCTWGKWQKKKNVKESLTCYSHMPVGFPFIYNLHHFLWTRDKALCAPLQCKRKKKKGRKDQWSETTGGNTMWPYTKTGTWLPITWNAEWENIDTFANVPVL